MKIKTQIKEFLKASGMKPYILADKAKIARPSIYYFLKGERDISLKNAEKLLAAINRIQKQ
jgi:predicted transcriptional regulator